MPHSASFFPLTRDGLPLGHAPRDVVPPRCHQTSRGGLAARRVGTRVTAQAKKRLRRRHSASILIDARVSRFGTDRPMFIAQAWTPAQSTRRSKTSGRRSRFSTRASSRRADEPLGSAADRPVDVSHRDKENAGMLPSARGQGRVSEAIVHRIKGQISKGRLLAGHKLPAARKMARQFKTSRSSSRSPWCSTCWAERPTSSSPRLAC